MPKGVWKAVKTKTGEVGVVEAEERREKRRSRKVFKKKVSERMPKRKMWDYAIELKEGFVLRKEKVYLLSREEREEVHKFIDEQLRKGSIRLLKPPQIAPVFFVGKKNGKKKIVQDYQYLNEWTVKNNYPSPLILDVIKNIRTKKIFTKMDLR